MRLIDQVLQPSFSCILGWGRANPRLFRQASKHVACTQPLGSLSHSSLSIAAAFSRQLLLPGLYTIFAGVHKIVPIMSLGFSISNFAAIFQLCVDIQDIHDTLSASDGHDDSENVLIALESSKQNLQLWQNTWRGDAPNSDGRVERLWGEDGWVDLQKLLAEIAKTIEAIKEADKERENAKLGRRSLWKVLMLRHLRKTRGTSSKSPSTLQLALDLDRTIDQLWIHSEVSFESLHGIPVKRYSSPARDQQLARSVLVRQGAIALYQACQRSATQCELDLDLLTIRNMPPNPRDTSCSASDTSLFYHLLAANDPKQSRWDITAENFHFSEAATISPNIKVHEEPDLAVFESSSRSNSHIICIQTSYSSTDNHYFRVATNHTATGPLSERETLAIELDGCKTSTKPGILHSLPLRRKVELAYDLVQCGFYLLGTPWLASLTSKNLRGIETTEKMVCLLRVKTIPLDYIYLENPDALSESSQVFQIGMILIEIALDGLDSSDTVKLENPYQYALSKLPSVYKALGSKYYRACAFCVQDRRSISSYVRQEKYQYPMETGWEVYLKELLKEYHVQVLSR